MLAFLKRIFFGYIIITEGSSNFHHFAQRKRTHFLFLQSTPLCYRFCPQTTEERKTSKFTSTYKFKVDSSLPTALLREDECASCPLL